MMRRELHIRWQQTHVVTWIIRRDFVAKERERGCLREDVEKSEALTRKDRRLRNSTVVVMEPCELFHS